MKGGESSARGAAFATESYALLASFFFDDWYTCAFLNLNKKSKLVFGVHDRMFVTGIPGVDLK